jgi:hypothetical protein
MTFVSSSPIVVRMRLGCVALIVLCAACAAPRSQRPEPPAAEVRVEVARLRDRAFSLMLERATRVTRIGERLRVAAADLCSGGLRPVLGVVAATEEDLVSLNLRPGQRRTKASKRLEILWVEPGRAAARAGLSPGDKILMLEGSEIESTAALYAERDLPRESLRLTIERGGLVHEVDVAHDRGCFAAASLIDDTRVGAYKTRTGIYATTGLVRTARSDDELAIILGHEIAHFILGTGSEPEFESDADYLGLYLAARAGFDVSVAPGFWRRWAIRTPGMLRMDDLGFYTHPRSAERALALEATIAEIRGKQAEQQPLSPETPE